jgi:hypothetical protein
MGEVTEKKERAPVWVKGCQVFGLLAVATFLFLLLIPLGHCNQKGQAKMTATLSRIKQLSIALYEYASDNDGRLPAQFSTNADLRTSLKDYVRDDREFSTLNPDGGEIIPNSHLAGLPLESIALPEHTALVYETKAWPDRRTLFGFVDGHARLVTDVSLVVMEPALIVIPRVDTHDTPPLPEEAKRRDER